MRAKCLMQAGRCREGKALLRASMMFLYEPEHGVDFVEKQVETAHAGACTGEDLDDRDRLLRAIARLMKAAYQKAETVAFCDRELATVTRLAPLVPPRDAEDRQLVNLRMHLANYAAACYVRAGSCAMGFAVFRRFGGGMPEGFHSAESLRTSFGTIHKTCEGRV